MSQARGMMARPPRRNPGSTQKSLPGSVHREEVSSGHVEEPEAPTPPGQGAEGDEEQAKGPDLADCRRKHSADDLGPCGSAQRPARPLRSTSRMSPGSRAVAAARLPAIVSHRKPSAPAFFTGSTPANPFPPAKPPRACGGRREVQTRQRRGVRPQPHSPQAAQEKLEAIGVGLAQGGVVRVQTDQPRSPRCRASNVRSAGLNRSAAFRWCQNG